MVDGRSLEVIPVTDRGLAYGDGVFETVCFKAGVAPLWPAHMARLAQSCRRLGILLPEADALWSQARKVAGRLDGIVKVTVTRVGGRGYAGIRDAPGRCIVTRYLLPEIDRRVYAEGARLRWCRLRLAVQPALAGMKHLNRLEQVLARAEWTDSRIHEGLLCSHEGDVIGATSANVFVVRDDRLLTPRLDRCGVAGVARRWIMTHARHRLTVTACRLTITDIERADELFVTNAVRGIVPVKALGRRRYAVGPVTRWLGAALAAHGIGHPPGA